MSDINNSQESGGSSNVALPVADIQPPSPERAREIRFANLMASTLGVGVGLAVATSRPDIPIAESVLGAVVSTGVGGALFRATPEIARAALSNAAEKQHKFKGSVRNRVIGLREAIANRLTGGQYQETKQKNEYLRQDNADLNHIIDNQRGLLQTNLVLQGTLETYYKTMAEVEEDTLINLGFTEEQLQHVKDYKDRRRRELQQSRRRARGNTP